MAEAGKPEALYAVYEPVRRNDLIAGELPEDVDPHIGLHAAVRSLPALRCDDQDVIVVELDEFLGFHPKLAPVAEEFAEAFADLPRAVTHNVGSRWLTPHRDHVGSEQDTAGVEVPFRPLREDHAQNADPIAAHLPQYLTQTRRTASMRSHDTRPRLCPVGHNALVLAVAKRASCGAPSARLVWTKTSALGWPQLDDLLVDRAGLCATFPGQLLSYSQKYRNGAAHVERMGIEQCLEARAILLDEPARLMQALVSALR